MTDRKYSVLGHGSSWEAIQAQSLFQVSHALQVRRICSSIALVRNLFSGSFDRLVSSH